MFVHIKSGGVIEQLPWAGTHPGWIYINSHTYLGRSIQRCYPCMDLLFNEAGELVQVRPWSRRKIKRLDAGIRPRKRDWRHKHDPRSRLYRERRGGRNGT